LSRREFPFYPKGDTVLLTAASSAPTGVQAPSTTLDAKIVFDCYYIYNSGAETVYMGYGKSASSAQTNSVIPTAGNAQTVLVIPAGAALILRFNEEDFFSGITASASCDVFLTPGEGL